MSDRTKKSRSARLGVVLFSMAALMSFGVGLTLAAPPFSTTIAVDDITDLTVTVSGDADSPSKTTHHMVIDWGDGNEDVLPNFTTDAPWGWGPVSHTYAADGSYTITATLIHANDQGNDQGSASASTQVTVVAPCTVDCGGSAPPPAEVEGNTITKKPVVKGGKLAKTGPETTGMTVVGLMLLMAGATLRLLTTREDEAAVATSTH
jgi:hypothetical protein